MTTIEKLQAVLALEPGHKDARTKLNEIRKLQGLEALYEQEQEHCEEGWLQQTLDVSSKTIHDKPVWNTNLLSHSQPTKSQSTSRLREFWVNILEIVLLATVVLFPATNVFSKIVSLNFRTTGNSMVPILYDGDFVVVNRLIYQFRIPQRGDIIVFDLPINPSQQNIDRVIGLPGEQVVISDGRVFIDGKPLQEPYTNTPPRYTSKWEVTEGEFFVLGDDRNNSSDSHDFGTVPLDYIVGKVTFIYWPPHRIGRIPEVTLPSASPTVNYADPTATPEVTHLPPLSPLQPFKSPLLAPSPSPSP